MAKTVVVLGGSLGGLAVAHRLLNHMLPREPDLRVVLVSKNSHFYWSLASVRAVVLGLVDDDDDAKDGPERRRRRQRRVVAYDHLVVATGADAADAAMPWKAAGSHAACLATLHGTAAAVAAAAHVVVAGGGYTGVEVAAEIKDAFPAKTVVLVNAGPRLVAGDALAAAVERELARLSVDVRNNVRASVSAPPPRRSGPDPVDVVLSDGSPPLRTDLFLPTTGLVPNARFLPARLPTPAGYVDVVSKPRAGFLITDAQAAGVAGNIDLVLRGKDPCVVRGPPVDVFLCSIGRRRGAGRVGPIPVPSFLVWAIKGRTLGTERTAKYANGTMW